MQRIVSLGFAVSLVACAGAMGTGVSQADVVKKVAFDKECPEADVKVTNEVTGSGRGSYKVDACGENYDYEHSGTVIWEKGHGPMD